MARVDELNHALSLQSKQKIRRRVRHCKKEHNMKKPELLTLIPRHYLLQIVEHTRQDQNHFRITLSALLFLTVIILNFVICPSYAIKLHGVKNARRQSDPCQQFCDPVAQCHIERPGYDEVAKCQCPSGYLDISTGGKSGQKCKKLTNECLRHEDNDCDAHATCIDNQEGYTCRCLPGFKDQSADQTYQPGRKCVQERTDTECQETYAGQVCKCKAGFTDVSSQTYQPSGTVCKTLVNECTSSSLNDCHKDANCRDRVDGYTCVCKPGFKDTDATGQNPGRNCVKESRNPCDMNDCAPGARCIPLTYTTVQTYTNGDQYECTCPSGFKDMSPNVVNKPGRVCQKEENKCSSPSLNDCSKHAECIQQASNGYTCRCLAPYIDEGSSDRPGRICRLHPCKVRNECDPNAICEETGDDSYTCRCRPDYTDESHVSGKDSGRVCKLKIDRTALLERICNREGEQLHYNSSYLPGNALHLDISAEFANDTGKAIHATSYAPSYVATEVTEISHPRTFNTSWADCLLVNFSINTIHQEKPVDRCDLWKKLSESIKQSGGAIGGGRLHIGPDNELLNPCRLNFCSDVTFCPSNATCFNLEDHAECRCLTGFTDLRNIPEVQRLGAGLNQDQWCLSTVNWCALGLHNCSKNAECINLLNNTYTCKCLASFNDMFPEMPGRDCVQAQSVSSAVVLCPNCTEHGQCINGTCVCVNGYTGDLCEIAPASVGSSILPLILALILAILFLILACCCLLWLLSKLRWFRRPHWQTLSESDSSLYDQNIAIPRAQLMKRGDSLASGSSEFTIREEVEHRVTTDVIRTEETMSYGGEEHEDRQIYDQTYRRDQQHAYGYGT